MYNTSDARGRRPFSASVTETDSRLLIQDGLLDDRLAITRLSTFGVDSSDSAKLSQRLYQSRPLSNAGLFDVFARRYSFI